MQVEIQPDGVAALSNRLSMLNLAQSKLVKPLRTAENHFLQVLIDKFKLVREKKGFRLILRFDDETPSIWNRQGRREAQEQIPEFEEKRKSIQEIFDQLLLAEKPRNKYAYPQGEHYFPFRWGNAGTLPVIRIKNKEYYCLFYRDIAPIGWNIANGATDRRDELLDPTECIHRELREELIAIDPKSKLQYILEADVEEPLNHPDFALARRLWQNAQEELDLSSWKPVRVPVRWIEGPDSLEIYMNDKSPVQTSGYFLNINGLDFGIEVDRVAKFSLSPSTVLLDGELNANNLIGRPIGLFEVEKLNEKIENGANEFLPDIFFFEGAKFQSTEGADFNGVVHEFIEGLKEICIRDDQDQHNYDSIEAPFNLCPVTERIIRRYLKLPPDPEDRTEYDVFISFGSTDVALAERIYDALKACRPDLRIFFEPKVYSESILGRTIDHALSTSHLLIAVGTDLKNMLRGWPEFEWRTFNNEILSGTKRHAQLVPVVQGIEPHELPMPLSYRRVLQCPKDGKLDQVLIGLLEIIDHLEI